MRSHQNAYQKAVAAYFSFPWYFPPAAHSQGACAQEGRSPWASSDHHMDSAPPHCGYSHPPRSGQHPHVGEEDQELAEEEEEEEEETDSESDGGVECDLSNMEITEELRQYFAQTERHREERRKCGPCPARPVLAGPSRLCLP